MEKKLIQRFKIQQTYICIFLLYFLSACSKDWLDVKVDKQQAVPQSIKDMQAMLDDLGTINYAPSQALYPHEIAADGHYYTDAIFESFSYSPTLQNAYSWTIFAPFDKDEYSGFYGLTYRTIAHCNVVLSIKIGNNNKNDFDHVQAQALFHRAKAYYYLVQTYAPPYKSSTAKQDLGIPLRLNTNITEKSTRASVQQTYDQIINDLKAAIDHLPVNAQFVTRASRPAALGLLAKIYLSMSDYDNAFLYANEYLKLKNQLLDYNTISVDMPTIGLNDEVIFFEGVNVGSAYGTNYLVDQTLYDSYEDADLRKKLFFNAGSEGINFKGYYSLTPNLDFKGIATDEIYLIRAECYARKGDLANAMKDLNDLLRTRWEKDSNGISTYTDQTASDEMEALTIILTERRKELILRGARWIDLRRLNQEERFKVTLTRTIKGKQYTLKPESPNYTFPIPQDVIDLSGIQQNSAWE